MTDIMTAEQFDNRRQLLMFVSENGVTRELSPREYEAVNRYGTDIAVAFPIEGPGPQRYV